MDDGTARWPSWRDAMQEALYGARGFYSVEAPGAHFRTSVHTSALFAAAVGRLAAEVHERLGPGASMDVVDMGAGRGELLAGLAPHLPERVQLVGVDLRPRPVELPERIGWRRDLPPRVRGLLFANEWLDNVPLDVVEVDPAGRPRLVHVDPASGVERLGDVVSGADAAWLRRHWPVAGAAPGSRAEIGSTRDVAWTTAVAALWEGVAVAVDYHHQRGARPPLGTLTGFRAGREVRPVPDGSCDLTAHVALDACAAAAQATGSAGLTSLRSQRDALRGLGVRGDLPRHDEAATNPAGYLRRLADASEATALTDPGGLGAFGWLSHARGMPMPAALDG